MNNYNKKYLKYKTKYLNLKGGMEEAEVDTIEQRHAYIQDGLYARRPPNVSGGVEYIVDQYIEDARNTYKLEPQTDLDFDYPDLNEYTLKYFAALNADRIKSDWLSHNSEINKLNHYKFTLENYLVKAVKKYNSHLLKYTESEKNTLFDLWKKLYEHELQCAEWEEEEWYYGHPDCDWTGGEYSYLCEMTLIKEDTDHDHTTIEDFFKQNNLISSLKEHIDKIDQQIDEEETAKSESKEYNFKHPDPPASSEDNEAGGCNIS